MHNSSNTKCTGLFSKPANSPALPLDTNWVSYNSIMILSELVRTTAVSYQRLRAQSHKTALPLKMLIISSGPQVAYASVWLGDKSGVPMIPSSGLMIWYNGSQNSGKHWFLWFVIQNIKKDRDEQPEEKVHKMTSRRVLSSGASVSMKFAPLSQNRDVFINPNSPWTSSFTDFYEGVIMQAWSMINSISNRPLPFLENGGRVGSSKLLITVWSF